MLVLQVVFTNRTMWIGLRTTSHLTILMREMPEKGKIQRGNNQYGQREESFPSKTLPVSLIAYLYARKIIEWEVAFKAMFTLYWIVKQSVTETGRARASFHTRYTTVRTISALEQDYFTPFLKDLIPATQRTTCSCSHSTGSVSVTLFHQLVQCEHGLRPGSDTSQHLQTMVKTNVKCWAKKHHRLLW